MHFFQDADIMQYLNAQYMFVTEKETQFNLTFRLQPYISTTSAISCAYICDHLMQYMHSKYIIPTANYRM